MEYLKYYKVPLVRDFFVNYLCGMNQIKHILDACLIVAMGAMALYLYKTFPSGTSGENETAQNQVRNVSEDINSKGYQLFRQQCASCHGMDTRLTGPALRNVRERGPWSDKEILKKWLKNPKAFAATSPYAKSLMDDYGLPMQPFDHLTDSELEIVIDYISRKK